MAYEATTVLVRADAMGLLPEDERVETLDVVSFRKVFFYIQQAGIGKTIQLGLDENPEGVQKALQSLNVALEESPPLILNGAECWNYSGWICFPGCSVSRPAAFGDIAFVTYDAGRGCGQVAFHQPNGGRS